jgi:hypothetical protein
MTDIYPPAKQRPALLALREALGAREGALRRDECGDWAIFGRFGHIYAAPEGFQFFFRGADEFEEPKSSQGWTYAKRAMAFAKLTQDGDEEGILLLDRLPTSDEAEIIRAKLRIPKRIEYSEEELARRRAWASAVNDGSGEKTASGELDGSEAINASPGQNRAAKP